MTTKVKGEAIKEGSIPLSALSNEVKNKIENAGGGADWNAQKGEPGFIENKVFRLLTASGEDYIFTNPLKLEDFTPVPNEYNEILKYKKPFDAGSIQYVVSNKSVGEYGDLYDTLYKPVPIKNGKYQVNLGNDSGYVYVEEDEDYNYWLVVEMEMSECFFPENTIYVIDAYEDIVTVEKIPESYLPNTLLKVTPQNLTSTDKNQALANLGIDPIVWKYMCNPIVITSENDVLPTDILIDDSSGATLILPQYAGLIRGGYNIDNGKYVNACAVKSDDNGVYDSVYIGGDFDMTVNINSDGTFLWA